MFELQHLKLKEIEEKLIEKVLSNSNPVHTNVPEANYFIRRSLSAYLNNFVCGSLAGRFFIRGTVKIKHIHDIRLRFSYRITKKEGFYYLKSLEITSISAAFTSKDYFTLEDYIIHVNDNSIRYIFNVAVNKDLTIEEHFKTDDFYSFVKNQRNKLIDSAMLSFAEETFIDGAFNQEKYAEIRNNVEQSNIDLFNKNVKENVNIELFGK